MKNTLFTRLKYIVALICGLFSAFCAAASTPSDMDRLLALSGLSHQLEQFPAQIKASLMQAEKQQGSSTPEDTLALMLESIDRLISPALILAEVRRRLKAKLNEKAVAQLLGWYQSEIGRHITEAEEQAAEPEAVKDMMEQAPSLLANKERVALARRLDKLTGSTEIALQSREAAAIAIYSVVTTVLPPQKFAELEKYKAHLAASRPQIRKNIEQLVILNFVYAYRTIDDNSLAKYEDFLNSAAARNFLSTAIEGLAQGTETVIMQWADDVMPLLQRQ